MSKRGAPAPTTSTGARNALREGSVPPRSIATPSQSTFPSTTDVWTTPRKDNPATPNPAVPGAAAAPNPNPPHEGETPASAPGPLTGPQDSVFGVDAPEALRVTPSDPWGPGQPGRGPADTGGE